MVVCFFVFLLFLLLTELPIQSVEVFAFFFNCHISQISCYVGLTLGLSVTPADFEHRIRPNPCLCEPRGAWEWKEEAHIPWYQITTVSPPYPTQLLMNGLLLHTDLLLRTHAPERSEPLQMW